ncbi:MAG: putative Na+/H+ antiporter [Bdellovibrionaceae bacterium]|nr:putative Na+/H+ antiporter [Pseudobdellovibrionaceae bacterium]
MSSTPSLIEIIGTVCFALAVLHTFSVGFFQKMAHKYKEGSIGENLCHFLGEVEVVFGLWAGIFVGLYSLTMGFAVYDDAHHVIAGGLHYLESQNFTEPGFVFVIMCMAATRPIILLAGNIIRTASRVLPFSSKMSFYISALVVGPILGSFITEPAAMTVTSLILVEYFYSHKMSTRFKYATIGLLFVNISIGGTLTHFAAPPVLMVASKYGWGMEYMFLHFGWKAVIAIVTSTAIYTYIFRKELTGNLESGDEHEARMNPTWWMYLAHILFIGLTVYTSHHLVFFAGLFLFFIGFVKVTEEYQDKLKLRESLLVGFFLGGLVVLGSIQKWWLQDVLVMLGDLPLYFGATALTAITDNAALTYLGSLVDLSEAAKYYLVAGAVTGGGLTVIANAPNPAGYGMLKDRFEGGLISPLKLLLAALLPTIVSICCFLLLPSF